MSDQPEMPLQPTAKDEHGTLRFVKNRIVEKLLDDGPFDLNDIASWGFSEDERFQLNQMLGYSVSGIPIHYDKQSVRIEALICSQDERDSLIAHYESQLATLRSCLREPMADLFEVHPDDLNTGGQKL